MNILADPAACGPMQTSPQGRTRGRIAALGNKLSILVVDDHKNHRRLLAQMLARLGITSVHEASDGYSAVELCANQVYDVIFMDISMPGMDGMEACARIRALGGTCTTRIIACTAHVSEGALAGFSRRGFDSVLTKPFLTGTLSETLSHCGAGCE